MSIQQYITQVESELEAAGITVKPTRGRAYEEGICYVTAGSYTRTPSNFIIEVTCAVSAGHDIVGLVERAWAALEAGEYTPVSVVWSYGVKPLSGRDGQKAADVGIITVNTNCPIAV